MKRSFSWREIFVVILSLTLAWGIRGQHGHERGAALAGAMVGLSLAAVTGGPRWIGAAVIGSLTFAVGGSLSYGQFIARAYAGSLQALGSLALIGFVWGGIGALGLGLGLALPKYRLWERVTIAGSLWIVWFLIDRLLWARLTGPEDLLTRQLMAVVLFGVWGLLSAYVGVFRQDRTSLRLALTTALGFSIGFVLATWIQGIGPLTMISVDWWKIAEHLIGFCGGVGLCIGFVSLEEPTWMLPLSVRPWERWLAVVWLLWVLPLWILANNLDFWIIERAILPFWIGRVVWIVLFLILILFAVWGWSEIRTGRTFVTSWLPHQLRQIFLIFLWVTTLIAASKTVLYGSWTTTPLFFVLLALFITVFLRPREKLS